MVNMRKVVLSKRLKAAANLVKKDKQIVDIGSDHAYLPIYLIQEQFVKQAIAGEVIQGPYQKALQEVNKYYLSEKIEVRLGDGFEVITQTDEFSTVFICGMGGILIENILDKGLKQNKIPKDTRLVLQANNNETRVRQYLEKNNYEIIAESIVEENEKFYEVIAAELTKKKLNYTEEELFFGPKLLEEKSSIFIKKWTKELKKNKEIIERLKDTQNKERYLEFIHKNKLIQKVIQ